MPYPKRGIAIPKSRAFTNRGLAKKLSARSIKKSKSRIENPKIPSWRATYNDRGSALYETNANNPKAGPSRALPTRNTRIKLIQAAEAHAKRPTNRSD
jgi:hypothetical protein